MDPSETLVAAVTTDDLAGAAECLARHPELRSRLNDSLPGLPFDGTVLLAAVSLQNTQLIDLLLANGANINQRSHWWAGGFGVLDSDHDLAEFLIARGAIVDIHAASRLGRSDTVRTLLAEDPSRVHARGGDGQTPLHVAASVEIAALLLEAGADIDARDVDHESTAAQYAVRERQDVARYLVAQGCATDLLLASALADLNLVRRHLDVNPGAVDVTVSAQDFPMINPRAGGTIYIWTLGGTKSAHAVARDFGHEEVFRMLMSRSSPVTALAAACEVGDDTLVGELLKAHPIDGQPMAERQQRRLVDAAEINNANAVRLMIQAGWPIDARGKHGATALHFAAWHGNSSMVRDLLARQPALEIQDRDFGFSPLGWAFHGSLHGWNCERGDYPGTVEALLAAGSAAPANTGNLQASEAVLEVLRRR
jgi:ankyrin repeat protein